MKPDWAGIAETCESLLRGARWREAVAHLRAQPVTTIPTHLRPRLASVARRASAVELSLKIIAPCVRGTGALAPRPEEWLEYAAGLHRLGVIDEALTILRGH